MNKKITKQEELRLSLAHEHIKKAVYDSLSDLSGKKDTSNLDDLSVVISCLMTQVSSILNHISDSSNNAELKLEVIRMRQDIANKLLDDRFVGLKQ